MYALLAIARNHEAVHDHHYLQPLIEPRAVAVIGASERSGSLGYTVIRNLLESGFTGRLFAVNPKHKTIFDLPSYPSIEEVPHRVDLAVVVVAAEKVPAVVEGCGRAGVKMVAILSGAFGESGPSNVPCPMPAIFASKKSTISPSISAAEGYMLAIDGISSSGANCNRRFINFRLSSK